MSRSRAVVLCIAVGLSALVANSSMAFLAGLNPAIFRGVVFHVLLGSCAVCWTVYWLAVREDRRQRDDRAERVQNFSTSIHYADGDTPTASGTWRRTRPSI